MPNGNGETGLSVDRLFAKAFKMRGECNVRDDGMQRGSGVDGAMTSLRCPQCTAEPETGIAWLAPKSTQSGKNWVRLYGVNSNVVLACPRLAWTSNLSVTSVNEYSDGHRLGDAGGAVRL